MDSTIDRELKRARSYCLRLLSISSRTERQIVLKLEEKGYSEEASGKTMDALKGEGLVDDERFARDWTDSRQRSNPRSRKMLKKELIAKGVEADTIDKVLSEMGEETDDVKTALAAAERKLAKTAGAEKDKAKVFRYLLGRGFDMDTAEEAVRKVLDEDR